MLDLSKFRKVKREWNTADIEKAIQETEFKRMQPGIVHDVKISGVREDSVKFHANNPTWIQWMWNFENSAGESASMVFMAPIGQNYSFTTKAGKQTNFPMASFGKMLVAFGIEDYATQLSDLIISTDAKVLAEMAGFQCKMVLKWNPKKLHPMYDSEKSVYFLVDSQDRLCCEQPFVLPGRDEVENAEERYAEMIEYAAQAGMQFESSPTAEIFRNQAIVNPIAAIGLGVKQAPVVNKPAVTVKPKPNFKAAPIKPAAPAVEESEDEVESEFDPSEYDT